jgi:oligopeptide/dipeptide ABC transporter ATP-binding protein
METGTLLEITDLKTYFFTSRGVLHVLDGLNLSVPRNHILGLLGESGSGKSVTAYSVVRQVEKPGEVVGGKIVFDGVDLLSLSQREMQRIRGRAISMIFQDPRSCLNPVATVGKQLRDVLRVRKGLTGSDLQAAALDMLQRVLLPDAESKMSAYPHELSTGMCQRVMIALALACEPTLLIADEATTGLDVTIQYEIIQLLKELARTMSMTQIIITHDLGIAAEICDSVAVMYAGSIVEAAPTVQLFDHPRHPYSLGLLACRPRMDFTGRPRTIPGSVPDYVSLPSGCRFHPRCTQAKDICSRVAPRLTAAGGHHQVACHFAEAENGQGH